jgi:16S rRNA (guanine527-N7)-methyltransferase
MAIETNRDACRDRLRSGAHSLGLAMDELQEERLLQFLALLVKWNKAYNLTAVRDPLEMVGRHLLDSLAVLPHLRGERCLDMGTGAGLPGIPLAIMCPEKQFVLLDSNGKKIRFVRQAILELGLENTAAEQARVESFRANDGFDTLMARAFTALPRMLELTAHLRQQRTVLLAMKADKAESELVWLKGGFATQIIPLEIPYTEGTRCLIAVENPPA